MKKFNFDRTCIGSLPHANEKDVVDYIVNTFLELPFWPQLPKRSFLENMYVQYSENFPGIVIDENAKKIYVDKKKDIYAGIEKVLENYLAENTEYFSISRNFARGFHKFLELKSNIRENKNVKYVKGQVVGPVSYGLTMKDSEGKPIAFSGELEEIIPKFIGMKGRFQARKLKTINENVIIFLDEPFITSIGSSYVSFDKSKIKAFIDEAASLIKKEGSLVGVHCCGNTEWDFLLSLDIDIISFDAYSFIKEFLLYKDAIGAFLKKGGSIAWGCVPTQADELEKSSVEFIAGNVISAVETLAASGIDSGLIKAASIVTPSCGMGTMREKESDAVCGALEKVSDHLKNKL